jgi:acetyl esterase/lipase
MKVFAAACLLLAAPMLHAQQVWQPSPSHKQVPLWPGAIPDARPYSGPETLVIEHKDLVAGKPWMYINNVSLPTMTVYPPKGTNTGAAVVVFPGGGYQILAIDLEGTEACDWLNARGITCVLLKYRVPGEGKLPKSGSYPSSPEALEDAQRAIGLTRFHAAEWHIDPHKIGVMGFSAGGHMVAATSVHWDKRLYGHVDAADEQSCRPDFAIALYPGHLHVKENTLELNPDIATRINAHTPTTFLLQNENDDSDTIWDALSYEAALIGANVPVEFHSYATGGHAFGLRKSPFAVTGWPSLLEVWLHTIGVLGN